LLDLLEPHDDISIVAVPGATSKIQHDKILTHCSNLGDRVAVLDGNAAASLSDPPTAIAPAGRSSQGSFGAVYFPNIVVFDPLAPKNGAAAGTQPITTIAPSGHIAGIYARTDATRGVFKAPANEPVLGALDVSLRLSDRHQAKLNPEGINVLRLFNGSITVWGARTQADEAHSEYRYISTRRFFNFLRSSIIRGTQFVVFEPNSPALWQRIVRSVSDFLLGQWRDGALFGDTPKQAFFVKCDETTNPPDVREAGQVVTEIGIAIVKPAEFVIFRIEQQTGA
jgi:Bacteriophage tail sheath protein